MTTANPEENVRAKIQLLSMEQMKEIHQYSINILENTGIKVESKTARKIFEKSKAVKIENEVVFIQGELINQAIKQSPSNIELFDQKGIHSFHLGEKKGHETHFGIGVTNTYFRILKAVA